MKKLDPKIIRVYDKVRIINPIIFIRCGYPLGIEDMRKEIEEYYGTVIDDLYRSVQKGDKLMLRDANGKYEDGAFIKVEYPTCKENHNHNEIINALAYSRLKAKKFGGTTRSLHTKVMEELRGKETTVDAIKIVQTGEYFPNSGGYDYWSGGYEYEPAGLTDVKSHKILTLNPIYSFPTNDWHVMDTPEIKIEAINVEKIPNEQETPIEYARRVERGEIKLT